jgi:hypothetical protein
LRQLDNIRDTTQVKNTVATLFSALASHNYEVACNEYSTQLQILIAHAAQQAAGLSTRNCATALAAIERSVGPSSFAGLGHPHFQSVTLSDNTATVTISVLTPRNRIAHSTFSVIREPDRWKVDKAASLQFSSAS